MWGAQWCWGARWTAATWLTKGKQLRVHSEHRAPRTVGNSSSGFSEPSPSSSWSRFLSTVRGPGFEEYSVYSTTTDGQWNWGEGWRETLKSVSSTALGKQLSVQLVSSPKTSSGVMVTDLGQKPSSVKFSECISCSSWSFMPQYLLSDLDTAWCKDWMKVCMKCLAVFMSSSSYY